MYWLLFAGLFSFISTAQNLVIIENKLFLLSEKDTCWVAQVNSCLFDPLRKKQAVMLAFDRREMKSLSIEQQGLPPGYKLIKSKFRKGIIRIEVYIDRQKYKMILDIAYQGNFTIKTSKKPLQSRSQKRPLIAAKVKIGQLVYNSTAAISAGPPRVGIGFIKGFNWVIDFAKKKVYFKKNELAIDQVDYASHVKEGI